MHYYILCPAELETGGSEMAHQLCHVLLQQGHQAFMYYTHSGQAEPIDVDASVKYRKYGTDHVKSLLEMKLDSIIIVPEALTTWIEGIPVGRKVVWWMSVDGYIINTKEENLKYLEKKVDYHLVQSFYAKDYLLKRTNISTDRILFVSDYIGDSFGQFMLPAVYRQNIVLFNPLKGFEDFCPLMTMIEGIKWVPLKGMTEEQMVVIMQSAKAYVDFGSHPGKDRIPREAASCGCCVITNRKGSAAFYDDVPIAEEYKFKDVPASYDKIAVLLKDICENYEIHLDKFKDYRQFIANEKRQFKEDVCKMTETFQREFGVERKNILLVKGITSYEIFGRYMDELASVIRKLGCNTYVLDIWSQASLVLCRHIISKCRFDAVIDLSGMLCEYEAIKSLPKESVYCMYLCNPPKSLDKNLQKADERTIVFCCDGDFQNYIERFYSNIKHTEFAPSPGSSYLEGVSYEDRTIDIIFIGTYEEPEKKKKNALAKMEGREVLVTFMEDMFEDIIINAQHTLSDCLSAILNKYNLTVTDEEFDELMGEFMDVHWYACSYYQDRLIRILLSAGLKIHVFGNGWEDFCCEQKENLMIHEGGAYAAGKALANAKIALNIMPWYKDGFQEGIASAMLNKTVAVTDESKYIQTNFKDGKDLILYSLKDMETLAERINYLLAHPKEAAEIAGNGYRKAQNLTWQNRACDMLRRIEADFGVPFIQEEEGRELELEAAYPDQKTAKLDAIYALKKMADFAELDMGKTEKLSGADLAFLLEMFHDVSRKFEYVLPEMELNSYILECMRNPAQKDLEYAIEFFSLQCQALMGELLLDACGLKL